MYDVETIKGIFTYCALDVNTEQIYKFVIHNSKNDLKALKSHLMQCKEQIGFNNINFDYPILHFILINDYLEEIQPKEICRLIHEKAQEIITEQNEIKWSSVRESEWKIKQIDLFKMWHYSNKNRWTSLKALEISMNYPFVMEIPIKHDEENIKEEQIEEILNYNLNDVKATFEFYKKSFDKIELRKGITAKYKLPCISWNNGKIGEQLILNLYCKKTKKSIWDVKQLRTYRNSITLKDCIPEIEFKSKEFNSVVEFFKNSIIVTTKDDISKSVNYKDFIYDFALGGIHGVCKSGIYESNEEYIIKSCDVASLYPNLAIVYNFYIEHLGKEFLEVYKNDIVDVRMKEKAKGGDKSIIDGFKEAANVPYGKSNDKWSFLYDPLYTMKTTIHGQLLIAKLCEMLLEIPNSEMLACNTDGLEIKIPRTHKNLYYDICKEWEKLTNLTLEYTNYNKMWIRDINNYGCISDKDKIKNKGCFEVDKMVGNEPAYHKDNSFRIIPYALEQYFSKGIQVEETICSHKDIYDYCGRQKFNKFSYGEIHYLKDGEKVVEKQQKNVRYYISNPGVVFMKQYTKGTDEMINKGWNVTIFNNYIKKPIEEYNIDYSFYIQECNKIIEQISSKQLQLF